jgi:hypothetical protein
MRTTESFVDTFKTKLIADRVWRTRSQLELAQVAVDSRRIDDDCAVGELIAQRPTVVLPVASNNSRNRRDDVRVSTYTV